MIIFFFPVKINILFPKPVAFGIKDANGFFEAGAGGVARVGGGGGVARAGALDTTGVPMIASYFFKCSSVTLGPDLIGAGLSGIHQSYMYRVLCIKYYVW